MSNSDDISLLMLLLQERKYPYFEYEEMESLLEANGNEVYLAASNMCLMKADMDKETTVGPITIKGPGADYWINLSTQYLTMYTSSKNASSGTTGSGYKTMMKRADEM